MKKFLLIMPLLFLALGTVACSKPKIDVPQRDVPISKAAAQRFEQKLASLKDAPPGDVKIRFTESEITSYINLKLADAQVPIRKPTVWFSSGKVYIKGRLKSGFLPVSGDALLIVALAVQGQKLSFHVEKAIIAGLPVPQSLLKQLTDVISQKASTQFGPVTIKKLQILEGEAIVVLNR